MTLSHLPKRRWLKLGPMSGRPGSKHSGVSMETQQRRIKWGRGMGGVARAWCGPGARGDLPFGGGGPTTGQLTGQRGHPLTAPASSGLRDSRLGPERPLGETGGWEPFQQLWPFLQGIYRTLKHRTRPGRDRCGLSCHAQSHRRGPLSSYDTTRAGKKLSHNPGCVREAGSHDSCPTTDWKSPMVLFYGPDRHWWQGGESWRGNFLLDLGRDPHPGRAQGLQRAPDRHPLC